MSPLSRSMSTLWADYNKQWVRPFAWDGGFGPHMGRVVRVFE